MKQTLTVGLVQMACSASPEENLAKARERIGQAARKKAQLVCLQELYRTRYFPQTEDHAHFALAETVPGPTTEALGEAAREAGVSVLAPIFEKRAQGVYHNSAVLLDAKGQVAGRYRKMHIPDDPRFFEKFYFAPGDLGFPNYGVGAARVAPLICWDQWYPEGARLAALGGAQVLFYPTAIGWGDGEEAHLRPRQREAWMTMQRAHAIANGVFVCAVNRVGREDELEFWGSSFVAGPFGEILAQASPDREEILVATLDLGEIERVRHGWPFLRDRRIDAYGGVTSRWLGDAPAAGSRHA